MVRVRETDPQFFDRFDNEPLESPTEWNELARDGELFAREFDAIVTAPVHKGLINDAGTAFTGHTEYLAQRTHTSRAVMLLTTGTLRVALATTHL